MYLQELNLEVGQKASCIDGYLRQLKVTVECVKDFGNVRMWSKEADYIVNNTSEFIRVVSGEHLTSHNIGQNWFAI